MQLIEVQEVLGLGVIGFRVLGLEVYFLSPLTLQVRLKVDHTHM